MITGETWPQVQQELLPTVLGLLEKKKVARSEIWNYFGYIADSEGKPPTRRDPSAKDVTKRHRQREAKHLSDRHPELFKEFKEQQVSECVWKHQAT